MTFFLVFLTVSWLLITAFGPVGAFLIYGLFAFSLWVYCGLHPTKISRRMK